MHFGSLETQEARVALGYASRNSYTSLRSCSLNFLRKPIPKLIPIYDRLIIQSYRWNHCWHSRLSPGDAIATSSLSIYNPFGHLLDATLSSRI